MLYVYIEQIGGWWKYPFNECIKLVNFAVKNGWYELDDKFSLKSKPRHIRNSEGYYSADSEKALAMPLDQPVEWWKAILENEYKL